MESITTKAEISITVFREVNLTKITRNSVPMKVNTAAIIPARYSVMEEDPKWRNTWREYFKERGEQYGAVWVNVAPVPFGSLIAKFP